MVAHTRSGMNQRIGGNNVGLLPKIEHGKRAPYIDIFISGSVSRANFRILSSIEIRKKFTDIFLTIRDKLFSISPNSKQLEHSLEETH
jgi:hypothetical protein